MSWSRYLPGTCVLPGVCAKAWSSLFVCSSTILRGQQLLRNTWGTATKLLLTEFDMSIA